MVQDMVRRGMLQPSEVAGHHLRHVVTNIIGGSEAGVRVEVHKVHLESGDRVLLCSDGLTEMLADDDIALIWQESADPSSTCKRLVAQANERGGKDNVTVVVASFES
jgi:protein phosphatase